MSFLNEIFQWFREFYLMILFVMNIICYEYYLL